MTEMERTDQQMTKGHSLIGLYFSEAFSPQQGVLMWKSKVPRQMKVTYKYLKSINNKLMFIKYVSI